MTAITSDHPLIRHHLVRLRDATTPPFEFRQIVNRLAGLLAYEATQDLNVTSVQVQTPVDLASGFEVQQRIGIAPVLRAGVGMVDAFLQVLPMAEVWHLGMYRDEATATPVEYYQKLPDQNPVDVALIVDPMLATGGSAMLAVQALQGWGVERIKLCSIIAAQEGIDTVRDSFPDIAIHTCAIDPTLNRDKFIVPGLGDAGDRIFNTQS